MTPDSSARLSLGFACVAHSYSHFLLPIFSVVALALEGELGLSHGEAIGLILIGNILFGVAAPLAGWLGDRWSSVGMMTLFFFGTGGGMILTGFADTAPQIAAALAVTGLFASIYHPVGIAWLVRNSVNRGAALGINGLFGVVGPAAGPLIAGILIDLATWRAAFWLPGLMIVVTGILFAVFLARGRITESKRDLRAEPQAPRDAAIRTFLILAVTLVCANLTYHAIQAGLPKIFSERVTDMEASGAIGLSLRVGLVYLLAGLMQVVAGRLADRYPLKLVYLGTFFLQIPVLVIAANLGGPTLVALATLFVMINLAAQPAENSIVARYAPSRWRGLIYGLKFILAFGVGSLGIKLEGAVYDLTGGFFWLFMVLAGLAATAALIGLFMPSERARGVLAAAE